MSRTFPSDPFRDTLATTWNELEQRLDDLLRQAQTAPADTFRADFLRDLGQAVGAAATIWWRRSAEVLSTAAADAPWQEETRWEARTGTVKMSDLSSSSHRERVAQRAEAWGTATCATWEPLLETDGSDQRRCSMVASLPGTPRLRDAVEILWPQMPAEAARDNILRLVAAHREVAGDFLRREGAEATRQELLDEQQLTAFALELQRHSEANLLYSLICNGIGALVPSDRVFVVAYWPRARVLNVSRSESFDRRSPIVRRVETLASNHRGDSQGTWRTATEDAACSVTAPVWTDYWEESTSRVTAVLPLTSVPHGEDEAGGTPLGCLVVERFSEVPFGRRERQILERGATHAAACMDRLQRGRGRGLWGRLRQPRSVLIVVGLVALAGIGAWPVDLDIPAQGELQPRARRDVFAPLDGLVRELHVREGVEVRAGELLLTLANDDLDFEWTRLDGELQTARKQLATVAASRLGGANGASPREAPGPLAGEEERLKQLIQGLEAQRALLEKRQEQLQVTAPFAGRVVTPDLEQRLRDRPLRRGQLLCTIVDEQGEWELVLRVPDREVGHVVAARVEHTSLPLRYTLASSAGESHSGTIASIADWTEIDARGAPVVRMTATLPSGEARRGRAGTTVFARIHCGRRPLAYVWLRDLWELLRTHWLLS